MDSSLCLDTEAPLGGQAVTMHSLPPLLNPSEVGKPLWESNCIWVGKLLLHTFFTLCSYAECHAESPLPPENQAPLGG